MITEEEWWPQGRPESEADMPSNQLPETVVFSASQWSDDRFDFGAKVGFLSLTGDFAGEIYGTGFSFGGDVYGWTESGFGGGVSVEYFDKAAGTLPAAPIVADPPAGDPLETTGMKVVPVTVPFMYRSMTGRLFPYVGGGPGVTYWELRGRAPASGVAPVTKNVAFAWFVLGGVQFRASGFWVFAEAKYRSDIATAVAPELNAGGFNLFGGIRF